MMNYRSLQSRSFWQ